MDTIILVSDLTKEQASQLLGDAWWGGKNLGLPRKDHDYTGNDDGTGYVKVSVPLEMIRPNEAGDRYDGTVNAERLVVYVNTEIETPIHLVFGERMEKRGAQHANVMDGGHRVSAARLRQDSHIRAVMQRSDYERLQLCFEQRLEERACRDHDSQSFDM
ncbi:hypothetical protein RCH14_004566 [Massilia sp. MP_M2]|uniref:hypothetical protein n=1 Tax=Massilia sp. MP_M2 TaxID=3071713 RepID=UPI00319DD36C